MTTVSFSFIDELGLRPIRTYTLECDGIEGKIGGVVAAVNSKKWEYGPDIEKLKKKIRSLRQCSLAGVKTIVVGGYSGGPLGRRKYTFPSVYERPENAPEPDMVVRCLYEGSHATCSLEPKTAVSLPLP